MRVPIPKKFLRGVVAAGLGMSAVSSYAASQTWTFDNGDVNGLEIFSTLTDYARTDGGNPGGYFAIVDAKNSSFGSAVFPDIDGGKAVIAFNLSADIRVGNPTGNSGRPADGFSISYARANDPVVVAAAANAGNPAYGLINNFAVPGGPEMGTKTGIVVSFDTWAGNTEYDGSADIEGIVVIVDGNVVKTVSLPTRNGAADDLTSLQTGPYDANSNGSADGLAWVPFAVDLSVDGKLNVSYKNHKYLEDYQTSYFPTPGQVVLAGRTGNANENTHVDNLKLTTVVTSDTTPPSAPKNLHTTSVATRSIVIAWDAATDDSGHVGYILQRDGVDIATAYIGTSFTDSKVQPSSTYVYHVKAIDAAGNTSDFTADLSVTTLDLNLVDSPGFLTFSYFGGIGGTPVANLTGDPRYPGAPDSQSYTHSANSRDVFPTDAHENYGATIEGWLTPDVSGDYDFFLRSDDASQLFLSTDADPANDAKVAEETGCCNAFLEPGAAQTTAAPISLVAGTSYHFLIIYKEGGGGDFAQVAWRLAGDTTAAAALSPIPSAYLSTKADGVGADVQITSNPANVSVAENAFATFSITETHTSPYVTDAQIQWYENDLVIPGATGSSYTTSFVKATQNGHKFTARVAVPGKAVKSSAATLSVTADTTAPSALEAIGSDSFTSATITFSEPLDPATAQNAANYSITPALAVSAATLLNPTTVVLTTAAQAVDTAYTVTISNVKDTASAGNVIKAPGNSVGFKSYVFAQGYVKWETWFNIGGTPVANLTGNDRFIADTPDERGIATGLNTRLFYPNDSHENYGGRLAGWIIPQDSGDYDFFISSDDASAMWLSADENAPDITGDPIIKETGCCNAFQETGGGHAQTTAAPISLVAGTKYAFVVIWKEGGGGDYCQVAWRKSDDTTPAGQLAPIPGKYLWTYIDPLSGSPVIAKDPVAVGVDAGGSASFSVEVGIGKPPFTYQWQKNGVDIAGANAKTLTINNVQASDIYAPLGGGVDSGRNLYSCKVSNASGSATSGGAGVFINGALFIEAEDFNTGGGNYVTDKAIGMTGPYDGNAYKDLDATLGVDYNANGNNGQTYRSSTQVSAGKNNQHADGLPRGSFSVKNNWVVGWNDAGEWFNYTREFPTPAKAYTVIGRIASGGDPIHASLDIVSDPTSATPTLTNLGEFKPGRNTAAWDSMEFFPLLDSTGNPATVTLGGVNTVRFTVLPGALDFDYIMFVPATSVTAPQFTSIKLNTDGSITINWTGGGTLQAAPTVNGPWADVNNAASPYTFTPNANAPVLFGRIRK